MVWTGAYGVFAVEIFFKTGKSFIITQREFRAYFMLNWNYAVLDRKLTLLWTEIFKTTGSSIKIKPPEKLTPSPSL